LIRQTISEQLAQLRGSLGEARFDAGKFPMAAKLFEEMMLSDSLAEFLTLAAYQQID